MRVLITGGTGSLGRALIARLLSDGIERVCSYARCEVRAAQLVDSYPQVRAFVGDVRDRDRLTRALNGIDTVIHAAALKRVDQGAYHPDEILKTNVLGTENVILAAREAGVRKVMLISSDKAVHAENVYGKSKAMAEEYAVAANSYTQPNLAVAVCRYGNVLGSRGSVVHLWRAAVKLGTPIQLTDGRMSRFWITMEQAVEFVMQAVADMRGGEIFVPILPAASLLSLAMAIGPTSEIDIIGMRPGGEKLAELLLSEEEVSRAREQPGRIVIEPSHRFWGGDPVEGDMLKEGFCYRSDLAPFGTVSVEELRSWMATIPESVF